MYIQQYFGTPFAFDDALDGLDHCICYAAEAASNQAILKTLGNRGWHGCGIWREYGGQFLQVYHQRKLCFRVWKTLEEIKLVLQNGIRQFNVESESELKHISSVASSMNT